MPEEATQESDSSSASSSSSSVGQPWSAGEGGSVGSDTPSINSEPIDGEFGILLESWEDVSSLPLTEEVRGELKRTLSGSLCSESGEAVYGHPLSIEEAEKRMPPGEDGLTWEATVIPDKYFVDGKLCKGLSPRDFDPETKSIKPRRPSLPVTAGDFFSSLTKIDRPGGGSRYVFYGVLNGWPSLRCFELVSLEQRRNTAGIPTPKEIVTGQFLGSKNWTADDEGRRGIDPKVAAENRVHRAKLRGAPWTSRGWSPDSPGFVFWFEAQRREGPRLTYGTDMTKVLGQEKCTKIHMISHRYAVKKESPRDRLTYHSVCLLEWEHGEYATVLEAAYLNGIGGYKGQSNWYEDRDDPVPSLYKALPPEMISPWKVDHAEIRAYDVASKNLSEFKEFVAKYEGNSERFVDPNFTFSHSARLTFRSKAHIAQYLLNYAMRDTAYAELKRNCQTFTADLCSFVAGKKDVVPFHPVSRVEYNNRTYLFLYDSHMYKSKAEKKKKRKMGRLLCNVGIRVD